MKEKKKLTLDKEIIISLSISEMEMLIGGVNPQIVNPELLTKGTGTLCIPDTNYPKCDSFGCIDFTDTCPEPPQKDTLQCTGNGCISEQGSCVTCNINCNQVTKGCGTNMCMETDICLG